MAKSKNVMAMVGAWAFIGGIIISLLLGFFAGYATAWATSVLIVLGLVVGFLNVTDKEMQTFLLSTVALVIVTSFGGQVLGSVATIGAVLQRTLNAIIVFVVPATIVVALKAVYAISKDA
jgi:hypothetical protein